MHVNWFFILPTRRTTGAQGQVIARTIAVLCVALGGVCLYLGYTAPAARAEAAEAAVRWGWGCIAAGAVVYVIERAISRMI